MGKESAEFQSRGTDPQLTVVLVTESAFYPPYQGDSRRLYNLIEALCRLGWKVHVVHLHDEKQALADYDAMSQRVASLAIYRPTTKDLTSRTVKSMDSFCPDGLVEMVAQVVRDTAPLVLMVQFVFLSKCLTIKVGQRPPFVRVIDADNVFSGRATLYKKAGLHYDWFSTDWSQERSGLLRADLIMSIQENEFTQIVTNVPERPVVLVPHMQKVNPRADAAQKHTVLFVGADNEENRYGLCKFLEDGFHFVVRAYPDVEMVVVGGVCACLSSSLSSNVRPVGIVDDTDPLYDASSVVLNLAPIGTGLKIKTVEALCYGKCLISTEAGTQGLEGYRDVYELASTPSEFAHAIIRLFDNPTMIETLGQRAASFASRYFDPDVVGLRLHRALVTAARNHLGVSNI